MRWAAFPLVGWALAAGSLALAGSAGERLGAADLVLADPGLRVVSFVPVDPDFDYASCNAVPRPMDLRCDLLAHGGFDAQGLQYALRTTRREEREERAGHDGLVRSELWRTTPEGATELIASLDSRPAPSGAVDEGRLRRLAVDPVHGFVYLVLTSWCREAGRGSCAYAGQANEVLRISGLATFAEVLAGLAEPTLAAGSLAADPIRVRPGEAPPEVIPEELWPEVPPLAIEGGGTGAFSAAGARANLGAAEDAAVVHSAGDETISGSKRFLGGIESARHNGLRHTGLFPGVAAALEDLPPGGGALWVDAFEDDPVPFADVNPAGPASGRPDTLAIDTRRGGIRFLSSMPEYPSGASGAREELVPFVFQVRRDDPGRNDDGPGSIGEWNCGRSDSNWSNCPQLNSSWGVPGGSHQYWYSGQCNIPPGGLAQPYSLCSGPHIFEVRYPEQPGRHASKPVFAVGNGGAALYAPDDYSGAWRSFLTMFRGDDGLSDPGKANTPMFVFDAGGAFLDGGTFCGNTLSFPYYGRDTYPHFNLWVQHDIGVHLPAFVVEGTVDGSSAGQASPMAKFYDRSGKGGYEHPGLAREAFGFYSNSRLYLGSFRNDAVGDRGQLIEWEGTAVDGRTTRLRATEPTATRDLYLPNASGTLVVAPPDPGAGIAMWGVDGRSGNEVCTTVALGCVTTQPLGGGNTRTCSHVHSGLFLALCAGE